MLVFIAAWFCVVLYYLLYVDHRQAAFVQYDPALHTYPSQPLADPQGIAPLVNCTAEEAEQRATEFLDHRRRDGSNCPREELWLLAMQELDPSPDKLFFNIGANKGFTFIDLMAIWARDWVLARGVPSRKAWQSALGDPPCGACKQCEGDPYEEWPLRAWSGASTVEAPLVYAFEPLPSIFEPVSAALKARAMEERIKMQHVALSGSVGEVNFPVCQDGLTFSEECGIGVKVGEAVELIPVKMDTVDHLMQTLGLSNRTIDGLFVDTEGHDSAVLRGAEHTLSSGRVRFLTFEYHYVGLWWKTPLRGVIERLDQHGFDCFWAGRSGTWRITGCWHERYEVRRWTNIVCALRTDIWWRVLARFNVDVQEAV